jgi:RNA polymerase sigma-70 factor, ECF subfamily
MDATMTWTRGGTAGERERAAAPSAEAGGGERRARAGARGAGAGDAETRLGALFDRNHRVLFRVAARLLGDPAEAEDVVQESFLRAASRLDRVPAGEDGAQAWLVRVAVNLCRDRQRSQAVRARWARHELELGRVAATAEPPPQAAGAAAVARLTVGRLLERLPTRRRAVLVLHELEGWAVADIARALGLRQVTVRWHLSAARRDLARALDASKGRES